MDMKTDKERIEMSREEVLETAIEIVYDVLENFGRLEDAQSKRCWKEAHRICGMACGVYGGEPQLIKEMFAEKRMKLINAKKDEEHARRHPCIYSEPAV